MTAPLPDAGVAAAGLTGAGGPVTAPGLVGPGTPHLVSPDGARLSTPDTGARLAVPDADGRLAAPDAGCPTAPDPARLAAMALRQVGELLGRLDAAQLAALAAGQGRLVFEPVAPATLITPAAAAPATAPPAPRSSRPAPPAAAECGDVDATVSAIKELGSRAEVADYLRAHDARLTVPVLKQVARRLGPTVASTGRSKAELKRNIVEGTAGFRERSHAMSRGAWG